MAIRKLLLMSSLYSPNIGGVEASVSEIASHLRRSGTEIKILTKRFPDTLPEMEKIGNIPVYRFFRPKNLLECETTWRWLIRNEKSLRADLVHLICVRRPMPFLGLLLAKRWKVPLVVTFSGNDLPQPEEPETETVWNEGLDVVPDSVRQADVWAAYSEYSANLARSVLGLNREIKIVKGGVDYNVISRVPKYSRPRPYFFSARRLDHSKGVDLLISAFKSISKKIDCDLVIAGDGDMRSKLEKQAAKLGLGKRVVFLGNQEQEAVFSLMKGALAHICPSRTESGGLVNYEAQAAGCFTIGSTAGGIPEYIQNGRTGLLFKSRNIQELEEALMFAVNDVSEVEIIRNIALADARDHGWTKFVADYKDIYEQAVCGYVPKELKAWSSKIASFQNRISTT